MNKTIKNMIKVNGFLKKIINKFLLFFSIIILVAGSGWKVFNSQFTKAKIEFEYSQKKKPKTKAKRSINESVKSIITKNAKTLFMWKFGISKEYGNEFIVTLKDYLENQTKTAINVIFKKTLTKGLMAELKQSFNKQLKTSLNDDQIKGMHLEVTFNVPVEKNYIISY